MSLPIALIVACSTNATFGGDVQLPAGVKSSQVRVAVGHRWPSLNQQEPIRPNGDGSFRTPAAAHAVSAYLDANGNARLDPHREPSVTCFSRNGRWVCPLTLTRLVAHRVEIGRLVGSNVEFFSDDVSVTGEAYGSDGRPAVDAEFCLTDAEPVCATAGGGVFDAENAAAISPCALEPNVGAGVPISVTATIAGNQRERIVLPYPRPLHLALAVEQSEESYVLSGRAELPVTHAVVWIGSADGRKIRWSSEQDPEALSVDDRKVTASIERRVVNSCPDCKVMLQAAHVEEAGERAIISEARVFWQRRPGP